MSYKAQPHSYYCRVTTAGELIVTGERRSTIVTVVVIGFDESETKRAAREGRGVTKSKTLSKFSTNFTFIPTKNENKKSKRIYLPSLLTFGFLGDGQQQQLMAQK
ncbi:hypothetical protein M9H77_33960 [Catharanthus roseus]|uniref:Uncharacterized protein n=1 Tax=Catharanthus roseus TaxID=4058 RepID=A0ACB9ZKK6_CATRO|nr:hypothetical protein M9H77_33960 [Catharanthus roseus]